MLNALKVILEIQELDIKMIRLMRLKKERLKELDHLRKIKDDLSEKTKGKEREILEVKKMIRLGETELAEVQEKIKKLESQQHSIKKVEEFNALSQEMSQAEKEKVAKEQRLSDLYDRLSQEEDMLKSLTEALDSTTSSSLALEEEIKEGIQKINSEGSQLKEEREALAKHADVDALKVYDRLLSNKRDRVVVPIENRCCSGCHIMVTAQDENLVRKGERLVFCEHCSRIHYWPDTVDVAVGETKTTTKRRRRSPAASA